ncbi:MAG TPA: metallophosphoesterase [Verrucomicrobia bacterium]|nr:metallophosphoesterase [Verrucomicrobiota bacterium]
MDKCIAILGDIHANLDALDVVLDDCRKQGVTDFLCTGDVVGYNACPKECVKIIRDLGCLVVKGNHDHYITSAQNLNDFQPNAAAVIRWSRGQLSDEDLAWLKSLPFSVAFMGMTLVHATMDRPENFGYVFDNYEAAANFENQKTPLCFHGHTHCPMIYEKQMDGVYRIDPQDMRLVPGRKYFINVGSVGQPRDGDPRASYALYYPKTKDIRFRRLPYDVATAQSRIRAVGLPESLAQRLAIGK